MSKLTTLLVYLVLASLPLTGCSDDDGDSGQATTNQATTTTAGQKELAVVQVSIGDNFYKPQDVTVQRGQGIKWKNDGAVAHTVTADADSAFKFDSGSVDPRDAYVLDPSAVPAGKLSYYCTIHGQSQSGTVTIAR